MGGQNNIFNFKFWKAWFIVVSLYIFTTYIGNTFIYTDSFYYHSLSDKIDVERIKGIIAFQSRFQQLGYIFIPIVLLIKLWILAGVIFTGLFLANRNVSYKDCLKITLIAELVSVSSAIFKVGWLMIDTPARLDDLQYFSPLSISLLLNINEFPKYLLYPLQLFNLFEVTYWIVLVLGIMAFTNMKWGKSLKVVASSYGVALFIWVIFIVFIQVQFT